jgi:hypothetical protein
VLPEQACCGNATWVKGSKCNASFFMETPVELLHSEHVADFAILIGFGTIKFTTINHS